MYPQLFLETFWRMEFEPQIFVAMSFAERYKSRFDEIITPAISSIKFNGVQLRPYRVDISKSGDSILTEIINGIAHSQMVLADISSIGKDSITGRSYRNGNVMYEVGLALASRQPTEVLLIRDDDDKFLFDVSTIPHITIDFTNKDASIVTLRDELIARLNERKFINDARIKLIISSLTSEECIQLKHLADKPHDELLAKKMTPYSFAVLSRLHDKQLIRSVGETVDDGSAAFGLTPFGYEVAQIVKSRLPQFKVVYENGENEVKT